MIICNYHISEMFNRLLDRRLKTESKFSAEAMKDWDLPVDRSEENGLQCHRTVLLKKRDMAVKFEFHRTYDIEDGVNTGDAAAICKIDSTCDIMAMIRSSIDVCEYINENDMHTPKRFVTTAKSYAASLSPEEILNPIDWRVFHQSGIPECDATLLLTIDSIGIVFGFMNQRVSESVKVSIKLDADFLPKDKDEGSVSKISGELDESALAMMLMIMTARRGLQIVPIR